VIALVFAYETDDKALFQEVYGASGAWAAFFRDAQGYVGTELLLDVEQTGRYLVVDRWESAEDYNRFVEEHRDEYMRRVDETAFAYRQELRLGTFENLWTGGRNGHPAAP
jgi:heme-degrading monooxygenase HmoA